MKPQLIIHIGPPKTGTTSLQHYFFSNRARHQAIIEYPSIGLARNTKQPSAHHNLARYFSGVPRTRAQFSPDCGSPDELLRALEERHSEWPILLSSEGFWGLLLADDSKRKFEDFLSALRRRFHVTLMATWRNAVDFSMSMYFHGAKRHIPKPFPFRIERIVRTDESFWRNITQISEAADHVIVVKYSKDIVATYVQLLNDAFKLRLSGYGGDIRENASFNTAQKMFALACSLAPDALDIVEYKRIVTELSTVDLSDSVSLKLDGKFHHLRQQSEQTFSSFKSSAKITVADDREMPVPRWTPQPSEQVPIATASASTQ